MNGPNLESIVTRIDTLWQAKSGQNFHRKAKRLDVKKRDIYTDNYLVHI